MRKPFLAGVLAVAWASSAPAQQWQRRDDAFFLSCGDGEILFRGPGVIEAGLQDGPRVTVAFFMWHDNWIYERLDAGQAEEGPAVDARGWVRQRGLWGTRGGAPPLAYELALEPCANGVVVHLYVQKTAPLKLTAGIWCVVSYDKDGLAGRQAYIRPTAHGRLGSPIQGDGDALLVELAGGRAVCLSAEGFLHARSRDWPGFEVRLRPGDFGLDEKVPATLNVTFADMPSEFPGEIKPRAEKLEIRAVTPEKGTVPLYGKLELDVDLHGTWDNPFDPDDVALDGEVTTASGRRYVLPGFFMVAHRRELRNGTELAIPEDNGRWKLRLAATELGPLRVRLIARDRSGTVARDVGPFTVEPSRSKGFLRQSRVDPRYLQFDNGAPFCPIGHNLPIYHTSGQTGEAAIRKMAAAGENYNRWWMASYGLGIEWEGKVGWYRQAAAARLDVMLDLAEELDFYYMLCMDTHQDFLEDGWRRNPYNAANGGPCQTVKEWFTNEEARTLYRKRLRYTVARWAYSPHVLCWEFGNEFEGWPDTDLATKIEWHREMAAYLAALDPYRHLITTSWWGHTGPEECWRIPEMDIVQTHCYTNNDDNVAEQVRGFCLKQWQSFQKPHIFGEFGIRSHSTTEDKDPKGWALHNAFWAGLCSGTCGIPMPWWHENYIDPLDLYFHFTAIRRFADGLPFGTARWEQVPLEQVGYSEPPEKPMVKDIVLTPSSRWGRAPVAEFHVAADGSINDAEALQDLLHGRGHPDLRNPPNFVVTYPQAGQFVLTVGRVSNSGLLRIWVDDNLVLEREFPCGEGIGKEFVYRPQWDLWESVYDEDVVVDVPAGRHRIAVDNDGKDWMQIKRYVFTGCRVVDRPNLLVAGLAGRRPTGGLEVAILWVQNRDSDWYNHGRGEVPVVPPSVVTLGGFEDGSYEVEWWETWSGAPVRTDRVHATDGRLTLAVGELATDIAAKIRPAP